MSVAVTLAVSAGMPACQTRCFSAFDCGEGSFCTEGRCETECFVDDDCVHPPDCRDNPLACAPRGVHCNALGRCVRGRIEPPPGLLRPAPIVDIPTVVDGWETAAGTGDAFIVDTLAIAGEARGFDLDGLCRGPGDCIDNSLHILGEHANDQIQQGLIGGETLLLVELAGLERPFLGSDDSLTVKLYAARDADDPYDPTNNFGPSPGQLDPRCCEFKLNPLSTHAATGQARSRAPARLIRGQLRSLVPVPVEFVLTIGSPPHPQIRVEKLLLSGRVSSNLEELSAGLMGGAVPVNSLAQIENPYCRTLNNLCPHNTSSSTLIDVIVSVLQPDIDLDVPADGLATLTRGSLGVIEECRDGRGRLVPPLRPALPHTCARHAAMVDGYSVAFTFSAVRAAVVGVGQ